MTTPLDSSGAAATAAAGPPLLEAVGIEKRFAGVRALKAVDIAIKPGTVHALVGENGAGKSTLGRVIAGAHGIDGGTLRVDGREVSFRSPRDALLDGIALIAQELELVPQLTVAANIMLGQEPRRGGFVARRALRARVDAIIAESEFGLDPEARLGDLRVAEQQKVEILRAVARGARLIVMDEPTAALTIDETEKLREIIRKLVRGGTSIVYVSHSLKDVLALADTVTVLRNGAVVRTSPAGEETETSLVEAILGRSTDVVFPPQNRSPSDAPLALSVRGLSTPGGLEDISFDIRRGEIVGVAGLLGSGRSRLARALFQDERAHEGEILLDGRPLAARAPGAAFDEGLVLLPEDRRNQGLVMGSSIVDNVTLPHLRMLSRGGFVRDGRASAAAATVIDDLNIVASSPRAAVATLSGGNQQKVLFGKCLLRRPKVLILDEPTRGVDVGAKLTIYDLICELANEGIGILIISSELEEVLGLAHRVLVMRAGAVVADLDNHELDPSTVMHAAFGVTAAASGGASRAGASA